MYSVQQWTVFDILLCNILKGQIAQNLVFYCEYYNIFFSFYLFELVCGLCYVQYFHTQSMAQCISIMLIAIERDGQSKMLKERLSFFKEKKKKSKKKID